MEVLGTMLQFCFVTCKPVATCSQLISQTTGGLYRSKRLCWKHLKWITWGLGWRLGAQNAPKGRLKDQQQMNKAI